MLIHIFFLFLYFILHSVVSPVTLSYMLLAHSGIGLYNAYKKSKQILSVNVMIYVNVILAAISNIVVIGLVGTTNNITNSYIIPEFISDGINLWCIGSTFTFIGFEIISRDYLPKIDVLITEEKHLDSLFYVMLFLSTQALFLNLNFSSLGSIGSLINLVGIMGIMFFSRLWSKLESVKYRTYAFILLFFQVLGAILFSYLRVALIGPFVIMFLGYFVGKGDIKYIFTYRAIPFIIIIFIFIQFFGKLGEYRSNFSEVFTSSFVNEGNGEEVEKRGTFIERSANISQLSNIFKLVQRNGFYNGSVSGNLVAALIPRFLWPDKPEIQLGSWFAVEIGAGYIVDDKSNNSINMTVPGELYLDFGWWGVGIGCFLVGVFMALIWNTTAFYESDYNLTGVMFGGYLFFSSFPGDLQIYITILSVYLTFLVIKKLL